MSNIAVFGLGYVGTVSAACFASRGHQVIGVDLAASKVDMINAGRTPVHEARIGDLVADNVGAGRLRATNDAKDGVANSQIAMICVGTPSGAAGSLELDHLESVAADIGAAMTGNGPRFEVVLRSTVLPGTTASVVIPAIEKSSGLVAGRDFGVTVNPEFLREGSSVADFLSPPKTVIGSLDDESAETIAELYEGLPGPVHRVPIAVAEMTKYADNSFHALKIAFANEIGSYCKTVGIDGHQVMDILTSDTKLNISPAYLRPGFAFGGSCLPKDLRAIVHRARHLDVRTPVLEAILPSNQQQIERVYDRILDSGAKRVAIYGLAFKSGTDDLRESATVALAERLLGRGFELRFHDPHVRMSQLVGANRAYVEARIPHLSGLIGDDAAAIAQWADAHVLVDGSEAAVSGIESQPEDELIVDVVRSDASRRLAERKGYFGVAW